MFPLRMGWRRCWRTGQILTNGNSPPNDMNQLTAIERACWTKVH
jgi:hypothetical protein